MHKNLVLSIVGLIMINTITNAQEIINIGAKNFDENKILGRMLTTIIKKEGYLVQEHFNIMTKDIRPKLLKNEIDIYWEYTGSTFRALLRKITPEDITISRNADLLYKTVKALDEKNKVIWLNKTKFNNSFVLLTRRDVSEKYQLVTISDLARLLNSQIKLKLAMDISFRNRPDGFKRLQKHYGFIYEFSNIQNLTNLMVYASFKRRGTDVGVGYGTDPQILEQNLIQLEDNQQFFPVYNAAPTTYIAFYKKYPHLINIINKIGPMIDQETMIMLNFQVKYEKKTYTEVANNFLKKQGLL